MSIFLLVWTYLKARPLNTALNILLLSLGIAVITILLLFNNQLEQKIAQNARGIDLVVGAPWEDLGGAEQVGVVLDERGGQRLLDLLHRAGFEGEILPRNIGPTPHRRSFLASSEVRARQELILSLDLHRLRL